MTMNNPKRILFVDDDPMVIRGFQRATDEFRDEWEMFFTTSGRDALTILNQNPMDVLITDMRMIGMDGVQLLENVMRSHPGVIRFVLSGNTEPSKMMQTTRLAHQYLTKPCDMEVLKQVIDRSCSLRDLLNDPNLVKSVNAITKLPSMPMLYTRLMQELTTEDATPKSIGDIISQDMAMTAKILQLVNSAFFGLPGKVTSAQKAVTLLGINTIKALVLNIHIFSEFQKVNYAFFSMEKLWQHSLLVGKTSQMIAVDLHMSQNYQADAQVIGLLHDTGKLLQLKIPRFTRWLEINRGAVSNSLEYKTYGFSHAEFGAYLMGLWGLPEHIVESVACHHRPYLIDDRQISLCDIVYIADGLVNYVTYCSNTNKLLMLDENYLSQLGVIDRLSAWIAMADQVYNRSIAESQQ